LAEAIRLYESHVGQAASRHFAPRHLSKGTLAFEPDYESARPDARRQEVEDSDWATPDINGPPARFDLDLVEQPSRRVFVLGCLRKQASLLGVSSA
jgi:hypothetical protein